MLLNFDADTQKEDMFGRKAIDIARFNEKISIIKVSLIMFEQFYR